jgi:galactose oxidase
VIPTAVANLPNGKLLVWCAYDLLDFSAQGNGQTWTAVWDPSQPNVKPEGELVNTTGHKST